MSVVRLLCLLRQKMPGLQKTSSIPRAPGPSSEAPVDGANDHSSHPRLSNAPPPQGGREQVRNPANDRSRRCVTSKSPPPRGREVVSDPARNRGRRVVTSKSPPPRGREPVQDTTSLRGARDNGPKSPPYRGRGPVRAPTNVRSSRFVTPQYKGREPVWDATDHRSDDSKNRGASGASAQQHPLTNPHDREMIAALDRKEGGTAPPSQEPSLSGPSRTTGVALPKSPINPPRNVDRESSREGREHGASLGGRTFEDAGSTVPRYSHSSRRRSSREPPSKGSGSHRSKGPPRPHHRRSGIGTSSQDPSHKARQGVDLRELLKGRK